MALKFFAPQGADKSWLVLHENDDIYKLAQARLSDNSNCVRLLNAEEINKAISLADEAIKKLQQGMPLAYIFEEKEFYGRIFRVTPDTLIPRPETEDIVDLALEIPELHNVLDLGTGSGCIGITLKLENPNLNITLADISLAALDVAADNVRKYGTDVSLVKSDLLCSGNFDLVVANLPYVNREWAWLDKSKLDYEPAEALYADDGGLGLYKKLFRQAQEFRIEYLVIEADPCQHDELVAIAKNHNFLLLVKRGFGLEFRLKR